MPVGTGCYRHQDGEAESIRTWHSRQCLSAQGAIGTRPCSTCLAGRSGSRQCLSAQGAIGTSGGHGGASRSPSRQCLSAQGAIGTRSPRMFGTTPVGSPMPVGTGCYRHTGMERGERSKTSPVANACRHRVLSAPRTAKLNSFGPGTVANACRHRVLSARGQMKKLKPWEEKSPMPVGTGCYRHRRMPAASPTRCSCRQCLSAQGAIGTLRRMR